FFALAGICNLTKNFKNLINFSSYLHNKLIVNIVTKRPNDSAFYLFVKKFEILFAFNEYLFNFSEKTFPERIRPNLFLKDRQYQFPEHKQWLPDQLLQPFL